MNQQLRLAILLILQEHEKTGSANFIEDAELAEELGQPIDEIQRQLRILRDQELVDLTEQFGPSYSAVIGPRGLLYLDQVEEQALPPKKPPIGFKKPDKE